MAKKAHHHSKRPRYAMLHKMASGVILLAVTVIVMAGFFSGASVTTIVLKASITWLVAVLVTRVATSLLATSEEMNSGEA